MKRRWAIERQDQSIYIIHCSHGVNPSQWMEDSDNDVLVGEVTVDNPTPDITQRAAWRDDGAGGLTVDLPAARVSKLDEIRAKRDDMLKQSDAKWIEETSKGASVTNIEADKTALRNLPASAQTALDALATSSEIADYDAFSGLSLNYSYD